MLSCFVIQPFDKGGKFDKRCRDTYKPAIEAAELEAYRVDDDPAVTIPIESIEKGIREAVICLADITLDNPNVWYELGYAFAARRPVVMVCSDERQGNFPFDIQHRHVIRYKAESSGDFDRLKKEITERLKALLKKAQTNKEELNEMPSSEEGATRQIAESEQIAPQQGLSQGELAVLQAFLEADEEDLLKGSPLEGNLLEEDLLGRNDIGDGSSSLFSLKANARNLGLTRLDFSIAYKQLLSKNFIECCSPAINADYRYGIYRLTGKAWEFIGKNKPLFIVHEKAATGRI